MSFVEPRTLGRTGLLTGRLGIADGFGASRDAYEEAFDRGCNYFTWGTVIKGRCPEMKAAIRTIVAQGKRDRLVLAMLSYAHNAFLMEVFFHKGLKAAGIEHADVLLLGYHSRRPSGRLVDRALALKAAGHVRFLGLTGHNRRLFPALAKEGVFDVFHVRYNAAHRGAESETFARLDLPDRPGIVGFTATRWGRLLDPKKMPPGETAPTAADCYRFVLSHPMVDVCMVGTRNVQQMRDALTVLESSPMSESEKERMTKIGDFVHGKKDTG